MRVFLSLSPDSRSVTIRPRVGGGAPPAVHECGGPLACRQLPSGRHPARAAEAISQQPAPWQRSPTMITVWVRPVTIIVVQRTQNVIMLGRAMRITMEATEPL